MARLILHIGSHKTGTTSIQHYLTGQEGALRRKGVAYLRAEGSARSDKNANALTNTRGAGDAFRAELDEDVARGLLRPEAETCVVSAENLFWLHDAGPAEALARIARERFESVRVIAYLRRQDMLALSHRTQVANVLPQPAGRFYGFEPAALPTWRPHFARYFDYHAKLELWRAAFGTEAVAARLFEPQALVEGDAVADFVSVAGLPVRPGEDLERRNTSGGPERTLLMLAAKRAGLGRKMLKAISARADDTGRLRPSRAAAAAFLENVAESNERLAQAWALDDGSPFRFAEGVEMYPETGTDVFDDATARAAIETLLDSVKQAREGGKGKGNGKGGGAGQSGRKAKGRGGEDAAPRKGRRALGIR